ncbi:hypothetical protein BDV59DRAFT_211173 [Aspergillus ambiguus]|uniref:uncharacterized protein n=1 Tax=Aspergillus ambiguus TaxID=176160 RepID=UPI003CCCAC8F
MSEEKDEFAFAPIQLSTHVEKRGLNRLDDGHEIQRPDVFDDLCQDLQLQTRIDRIVHGFESDGKGPATLVIFGFRFHGLDEKRRFKRALITITFRDEQKRDAYYDPEVISLWPNGNFTLGEPTIVEVQDTHGGEGGADVTAGAMANVGAHTVLRWERTIAFSKEAKSTLTGSITLDTKVRYMGPNNAIRLTISENHAAESAIVTDFRAAVLLRRKSKTDTFMASVNMTAKADFKYNLFRGVRNISGLSPPNGPVRFKPGVQYLRPPTLGDVMEAKLRENIDANQLNAVKLDGLAGVLCTTVLTV